MRGKVGIVGVGNVGKACATALLLRGSCRELALLDARTLLQGGKEYRLDRGVAADLSHGAALCQPMRISGGSFKEMADADIVVITAGINERSGGATNRQDSRGRLVLLERNAEILASIVPHIVHVAPDAILLVVTDPPDPLADVARKFAGQSLVVSAGTFLDTVRFKVQIAARFGCHADSVQAMVLGEHGTSQVPIWSATRIAGVPVVELAESYGIHAATLRKEVEEAVKFANIDIINGTGASQHGIGVVTARIIEAILRDEGLVAPLGIRYEPRFRVTLSLPVVLGRGGYSDVIMPALEVDELLGLEQSAATIEAALRQLPDDLRPEVPG